MVDTEIGPLPADLWGLLGKPAPAQPAAAVQRQPLAAPQSPARPPEPRGDSLSQAIQRAEASPQPNRPAPLTGPNQDQKQPPAAPAGESLQRQPLAASQPDRAHRDAPLQERESASPLAAHEAAPRAVGQQAAAPNAAPAQPPAASASAAPIQRTVIINDFEATVPAAQGEAQTSPAGQAPAASGDDGSSGSGESAESAPAAQTGGESAATQNASAQQAGAPQPDLDDIARQVYSEVKNRLMVEWERLRRRL